MREDESGDHTLDDRGRRALLPAASKKEFRFITTALNSGHDTESYCCSKGTVREQFLKQDALRLASNMQGEVFVCPFEDDDTRVAGFYHISYKSSSRSELLNHDQKTLSSKSPVPFVVVAELGRDVNAEPGLGLELLVDVVRRAYSKGGIWGIRLWAANASLVQYYLDVGFELTKVEKARYNQDGGKDSSGSNYEMYGKLSRLAEGKTMRALFEA